MLDPNHFRNLLSNPETSVEEDLEKLEQLLDDHPYLQSARALQLKIYKQKNSELYNDALRKTAAYTTDRDVLFQFITSEAFADTKIDKDEEEIEDFESVEKETPIEDSEIIIEQEELESPIKSKKLNEEKSTSNPKETEESDELENKAAKESLELNQPLPFSKDDSYSFSEWLQLTSRKPIDRGFKEKKSESLDNKNQETEISKTPKTEKVIHMVDAFLKNNPRPKRRSDSYEKEDSAILSEKNDAPKSLMTETLARVYLQQKNYTKAIQAYKILILRNPEKSGYFADKIRAIEKLTNKK